VEPGRQPVESVRSSPWISHQTKPPYSSSHALRLTMTIKVDASASESKRASSTSSAASASFRGSPTTATSAP
jgi:hypothetical protein